MYGIDLLVTSVSSVTKLPPGSHIYLISVGPFFLWCACYISYFLGQTVQNAILASRDKPVHDIIPMDEFWPFNLIKRTWRQQWRKQKIEQKIEQARERASICDMLNSRTEIVSRSFEHYGLTLISVRIHPYGDTGFACDLEIESGGDTELSDDVCIHVCLFDDNDIEVKRIDISIYAREFSGYVSKHDKFNIHSDYVPTHMKVYIDKKSWS